MPLADCIIVPLETRSDPRGDLTFVEGGRHVPFSFARLYYLHGVPAGGARGSHAHRELWQLMIAMAGSFSVTLDDGRDKRTVRLEKPTEGLLICPMIWRDLFDFSPGAVCAVLASERYDEGDYFREYGAFLAAARSAR